MPIDTDNSKLRKLTPAQWEEAIKLWELGEYTLNDLSDRFDVTQSALSVGFKRRSAIKGAKASILKEKIINKMMEATANTAGEFVVDHMRRVEETKEQHYKWSRDLATSAMIQIGQAARGTITFEKATSNLRAIRLASAVVAEARRERYQILKVDDIVTEHELPELTIRDLTDTEIIEIQGVDDEIEEFDMPSEDDIVDE